MITTMQAKATLRVHVPPECVADAGEGFWLALSAYGETASEAKATLRRFIADIVAATEETDQSV